MVQRLICCKSITHATFCSFYLAFHGIFGIIVLYYCVMGGVCFFFFYNELNIKSAIVFMAKKKKEKKELEERGCSCQNEIVLDQI